MPAYDYPEASQAAVKPPYMSTAAYSDPKVDRTAMQAVDLALEEASQLAYRVKALADRLCGSMPEAVSNNLGQSIPGAVLPAMRESASRASDLIREAMHSMSRIEREI